MWSDGSSHSSGGKPGGWAFIITLDNYPIDFDYGGDTSTSNNQQELTAAIRGLQALEALLEAQPELKKADLVLKSDSQYTLGLANGTYNPSKNIELAKQIRELTVRLGVTTFWVRGHAGHAWNEKCDQLAKLGKEEAIVKRAEEAEKAKVGTPL